ncbi:MAG TPA: condensation domain-containing protein, partial [Hymenobacter sp.]|nr:condensation domain-containing protein [Hymenobacter sp.]
MSIHDNFFNIGGDSIIAIRAISAVKNALRVEVNLSSFYQYPTVAQFSAHLLAESTSIDEVESKRALFLQSLTERMQPILSAMPDPAAVEDVFPMSDIQKGMVFASELNPELGIYHDQMMYLLPWIEPEIYTKALSLLVAKHAMLRTAFNLTDFSEEVQIVYKSVPVAVDFHDLTTLAVDEQQAFIQQYTLKERNKPFDLKTAPLWRTSLFRTSSAYMVYLFQFHHSILDGWSFASLNTEWFNLCQTLRTNGDYVPPRLKATYKDGVMESLLEKSNQATLAFWQAEMADYHHLDIFGKKDIYENETGFYDAQFFSRVKETARGLNVSPK